MTEEESENAPPTEIDHINLSHESDFATPALYDGLTATATPSSESEPADYDDDTIITAVRTAGPNSVEENMLSSQLERLGVRTLLRMTRDMSIFREWRNRGIRRPPFPAFWQPERSRVVRQSARVALPRFLTRYVHSGRWLAGQGCSIHTFFTNGCIYAYAEEYERFLKEESHRGKEIPTAEVFDLIEARSVPSHESAEIERLLELAGQVHAKLPDILALRSDGHSNVAIATKVGLSARHIDRLLTQLRERAAGSGE